ncbi:hypothetical protein A2U01_0097335, partial [Trifolium medium]|nr:hypothetical protein [Trifolium medium]
EKFICLEPSCALLAMLRLLRFFFSYNTTWYTGSPKIGICGRVWFGFGGLIGGYRAALMRANALFTFPCG